MSELASRTKEVIGQIEYLTVATVCADGILFLIRNDAMCGEILTIDGGMSLSNT